MNLKYLTLAALLAAGAASAEHYKVITPLSKDDDGAMARLVNFDSGATVDSVLVADGVATFEGEVDEPYLARVVVDGGRLPVFILESGTISFNDKEGAFGTMLNDQLRQLGREISQLGSQFQGADEAAQKTLYARYEALVDSTMQSNRDNPLGYYLFLQSDMAQAPASEIRAELAKYPDFAKYKRVQGMLAAAEKREATQPGKKYADFEVTYDGKTERLSDYIKPGKYTLVDFWASWCGPCIRETKVLKEILADYGELGLEVLGVAVWDDPENTRRAIAQHQLPWPQIIGAQTVPTELYGIQAIPCIILIDPEGNIVARDLQDEALKEAVRNALLKD